MAIVREEADGDYHAGVLPDAASAGLLNDKNAGALAGLLVVEIIPAARSASRPSPRTGPTTTASAPEPPSRRRWSALT